MDQQTAMSYRLSRNDSLVWIQKSGNRKVMAHYRDLMEVIETAVDGAGVLIIVAGALLATGRLLFRWQQDPGKSYRLYRKD